MEHSAPGEECDGALGEFYQEGLSNGLVEESSEDDEDVGLATDAADRVEVIAQTTDFLAVNKPSGLSCHRMKKDKGSEARYLVDVVRDRLGYNALLAGRLDRGTSGCVLFGLHSAFARQLNECHSSPDTLKFYVAIVRGCIAGAGQPGAKVLQLDHPVKSFKGDRQDARTLFYPLAADSDRRFSIVLAQLVTGRWQQIRQHLKHLKHPIWGDNKRLSKDEREMGQSWGLHRLALHCLSVRLSIPSADQTQCNELSVSCCVPDDLRTVFGDSAAWATAVASCPLIDDTSAAIPERLVPTLCLS